MKNVVDKVKWGPNNDKQMGMKIGINVGNVIAGIIGHHKP